MSDNEARTDDDLVEDVEVPDYIDKEQEGQEEQEELEELEEQEQEHEDDQDYEEQDDQDIDDNDEHQHPEEYTTEEDKTDDSTPFSSPSFTRKLRPSSRRGPEFTTPQRVMSVRTRNKRFSMSDTLMELKQIPAIEEGKRISHLSLEEQVLVLETRKRKVRSNIIAPAHLDFPYLHDTPPTTPITKAGKKFFKKNAIAYTPSKPLFSNKKRGRSKHSSRHTSPATSRAGSRAGSRANSRASSRVGSRANSVSSRASSVASRARTRSTSTQRDAVELASLRGGWNGDTKTKKVTKDDQIGGNEELLGDKNYGASGGFMKLRIQGKTVCFRSTTSVHKQYFFQAGEDKMKEKMKYSCCNYGSILLGPHPRKRATSFGYIVTCIKCQKDHHNSCMGLPELERSFWRKTFVCPICKEKQKESVKRKYLQEREEKKLLMPDDQVPEVSEPSDLASEHQAILDSMSPEEMAKALRELSEDLRTDPDSLEDAGGTDIAPSDDDHVVDHAAAEARLQADLAVIDSLDAAQQDLESLEDQAHKPAKPDELTQDDHNGMPQDGDVDDQVPEDFGAEDFGVADDDLSDIDEVECPHCGKMFTELTDGFACPHCGECMDATDSEDDL